MPGQESAHAVMQSRIRDNQRRSRARQKEYIHELEEKVQACERLGVQASLEIQQAARNVLEENKRLRALLLSRDLDGGGPEGGGAGGVGKLSLSSEAIYLQEKLERQGSCSRVAGGGKAMTGQHTGKGQQIPLPPLQRNMLKPAPSTSVSSSPISACCGGGSGSSSKCGVPLSPSQTGDVQMRGMASQEGKVAQILPPPIKLASSTRVTPLSATSPRETSRPPEAQLTSNARPMEISRSLQLPENPILASSSSDCCGPNTTCVSPLQASDIDMVTVPTPPIQETVDPALEQHHIKPPNGAMLASTWSSSDPDLRTELDPETDTSSCAFAVSIIAGMRSDLDPEDVKQALGCHGNNLNECKVENSKLFAAVDQFAE